MTTVTLPIHIDAEVLGANERLRGAVAGVLTAHGVDPEMCGTDASIRRNAKRHGGRIDYLEVVNTDEYPHGVVCASCDDGGHIAKVSRSGDISEAELASIVQEVSA